MVNDATTFFLSFATVFGGLGWYLLRLEQHVKALEARIRDALPATAAPTANATQTEDRA